MTLLQIQEPAAKQKPPAPRLALGIDLGTTNSLVAFVGEDGKAKIINGDGKDGDGKGVIVPSVVHYARDGAAHIGAAAEEKAREENTRPLRSIKRLMGRAAEEVRADYDLPYAAAREGMAALQTNAGEKTPVEISAEILKLLRARAEKAAAEKAAGAVVTVPAYFDEAQRQATKAAARIAGLPVLRLLSEPTAAALAYGLDQAGEGAHAVYDLGGGTFDISVLRFHRGVFEVLAISGDSALGGDDYDRALANLAAKKLHCKNPDSETRAELALAAKTTKEQLSSANRAELRARIRGEEKTCEITAEEFREASAPLTQKTIDACRRALRDAELKPADIGEVLLVGGATRMPQVREAAADFFGKPPRADLNPEETVALGAAAQADILIGNRRGEEWLLLDVIPLSLGLETMGGLAEKIIPRNSTLPAARTQEFTTHRDGQTRMSIHIVQGERELVSDCRSLARFSLAGIPPLAAGRARIAVAFQVDADGLLSVSAREKSTGASAQITVKPSFGLDEKQISKMLQESFARAGEDAEARKKSEAQTAAETAIAALEKFLAAETQDKKSGEETVLAEDERKKINAAIAELRDAVEKAPDAKTINEKLRALEKAAANFAEKSVAKEMRRALEKNAP